MSNFRVRRFSETQIQDFKKNIFRYKDNNNMELRELIKQDLSDPKNIALFAKLVLPHWFSRPFNEVHYRLFDHAQIGIRFKKNKCTQAYRGLGKSTAHNLLGNLYDICFGIHPYIVINGFNRQQSNQKLANIKRELETNKVISYLFGNPLADSESQWNKESIFPWQKVYVMALSVGQATRGLLFNSSRPTKVVSDDIITTKAMFSKEDRDKTHAWYVQDLSPALASDGVLEIINTPLHKDDLIEIIYRGEETFQEGWDRIKISLLDENGLSVDPDLYSQKKVNLLSKALSFAPEFLCKPVQAMGGLINEEWLRFWVPAREKENNDNNFLLPNVDDMLSVYIHWDITHTGKQTSDYFCVGAVGEGKDGNFYLIDFILDKSDQELQAKTVINFYLKIKKEYGLLLKRFTYDEKGAAGVGNWVIKEAKTEGLSLPLEPLKYGSDKLAHLEKNKPHFVAGRVILPHFHKDGKEAFHQLTCFPQAGVHDDFVDMLSGCLDNFTDQSAGFDVQVPELTFSGF